VDWDKKKTSRDTLWKCDGWSVSSSITYECAYPGRN
jgi:hypothetical protein